MSTNQVSQSTMEKIIKGSLDNRLGYTKAKTRLTSGFKAWYVIIVIGMAVSGMIAINNTYNIFTGIDDRMRTCAQTDTNQAALTRQFWIYMVLGIVAMIIGGGLTWKLKYRKNIGLGILSMGGLILVYCAVTRFQTLSNLWKTLIPWVFFFIFFGMAIKFTTGVSAKAAKTDQ